MNLVLHGLEPHIKLGDSIYEVPDGRRFDVVLTNPPFGTKGANQAGPRRFHGQQSNMRLPRGTFTPYSQGVKANVVFFTKGTPTKTVWIYDARTNVPGITKKDRPLTEEHFKGFEQCFGADPLGRARRRAADSPDDRWREFKIAEVRERQFKLDGFKWLKEDSLEDADDLPDPDDLAGEAIGELQGAVEELNEILALLARGKA